MSRATWVAAGLGLAVIVLLLSWMGRTLDTKAPIRIQRPTVVATPEPEPTLTAGEVEERERAAMQGIVARLAPSLARRAAEQAFSGEEAARARCTFAAARLVHRDESSAYWDADFSCVDPLAPAAFPNPTTVSVRLNRDGGRWTVAD